MVADLTQPNLMSAFVTLVTPTNSTDQMGQVTKQHKRSHTWNRVFQRGTFAASKRILFQMPVHQG